MILNILVEDPNSNSGWMALENQRMGLSLGGGTLAETRSAPKRTTATNPFIPGTYTVRATPDNLATTIEVRVDEEDPAIRTEKVEYLVSLFSRASFRIVMQYESKAWMVTAQAADYSINNQREFLHGGLSLVNFSIQFLPGRTEVLT